MLRLFWLLIGVAILSVILFTCRPARPTTVPTAQQGTIDLTQYNYLTGDPVPLNGQWQFSWQQFTTSPRQPAQWILVPGTWQAYTNKTPWWKAQTGHGTYDLTVLLPKSGKMWSLHLPPVHSSYRLFLNGQLAAQAGRPAVGLSMQPGTSSKLVTFIAPTRTLHIQLQVANYVFATGGIWSAIYLGNPFPVRAVQLRSVATSSILFGCLFIMGLYHLLLFALRPNDTSTVYFGLICLLSALRELFAGEVLFFEFWPSVNWEWAMKLLYGCFCLGQLLLILYCRSMFRPFSPLIVRLAKVCCLAYMALLLLTPNRVYGPLLNVLSIPFLIECGYALHVFVRAIRQRNDEAIYILFGLTILLLCFANDFLYQEGYVQSYFLLPFGLLLFLFGQSLILALRSSRAFQRAETLYAELRSTQAINEQMIQQQNEAEQRRVITDLKDRFFANITHELRTPLTLIMAPVDQLLQGTIDKKHWRQSLLGVQRNTAELLQLINQLLDLAKVEAGQMALRLRPGDVAHFIEDRVRSFEDVARAKGIQLTFEQKSDVIMVHFDAGKLDRILQNLLSNALKFTQKDGFVRVKLKGQSHTTSQATLQIEVQDSGTGIAADQLPYIFNRFFQIDTLQANTLGTGIGLSLAQELALLMGGQITVQSEIDIGSLFTLTLPVQLAGPTEVSPSTTDQTVTPEIDVVRPISTLTIHTDEPLHAPDLLVSKSHTANTPLLLIVEDNSELRRFITQILHEYYRIVTASDGQTGWEICQQELPDLVISDVMMPHKDGYQLCRQIKETPSTNHIAVILLTAKTAFPSKLVGLTTGANDYLTKPFDISELLLRVANLLRYQQTLRAHYSMQLSNLNVAEPTPDSLINQVADIFLRRVYQFIDQRIDNPDISVQTIADHMAVSSRTLSRKLTTLTGLSTAELVRQYRLRKATELLRSGYNVSETAYQVGFDDPSYFGQCFRELYKISPSDYARA